MKVWQIYYDYMMSFVGRPYRWGGANPISGFDCSGMCQELLESIGQDPPGDQTAQGLYDIFKQHGTVCMAKDFKRGGIHPGLQIGAFAFYGTNEKTISHVTALVNNWLCIGANGGGHKTIDLLSADRADAFVKMRPIDYRKDLIAVVLPNYPSYF